MQRETWKPVVGYEKTHRVSNLGRVKRLGHSTLIKSKDRKKFLRSFPDTLIYGRRRHALKNDYYSVTMETKGNGVRREVALHRMVATAFISNPKNKPEVNHKDGNKSNNVRSNLEWMTKKENLDHARKNGFIKPRAKKK